MFAATMFLAPATAQEPVSPSTLLKCSGADGSEFFIDLFSQTSFGPMHCIEGLDLADMTPCSPDDGWGLSYPTGTAQIATATQSWKTAYDHFGGKFTASLRSDEFIASAMFGEGLDFEHKHETN